MKSTRFIFTLVSIYIFAAFAWWTYSHVKNSRIIKTQQQNELENLCYKATVLVNAKLAEGALPDTNDVKRYVAADFPPLEIVFAEEAGLENFLIRPRAGAYEQINKDYSRRLWMYLLEGIVMVLLMFWGIILIYRSFLSRFQVRRQQTNFLLSVTHELKTPIASIKLYLETLQKRRVDERQQATIISNSLHDITRLCTLVDNMLLASQLENNKYQPEKTLINFSQLLQDTVDRFSTPRDLSSRIKKEIAQGISIMADQDAMVMVINNLLSNAFKYSPPSACIDVELVHDAGHLTLRVGNEGQCIPDDEKKFIFERFYRSEDENTRKSKGTGLGLFIVRNLLSLHNATIDVKDKKPSGVVFTITFNKNAA